MIMAWLTPVLLVLGWTSLWLFLHLFSRRRTLHPELVRKGLHVGVGLTTLGFPWIFERWWMVWLPVGMGMLLLLAVRFGPLQKVRHVLDSAERASLGDVWFLLSSGLVFSLSQGNPVLYCIPMLLLTLADAVAALIGVYYGRYRFSTPDGSKSTEGSLAFFTTAFLSTLVPLQLGTTTGRTETLIISLTLGLLMMILEAIAWRGADNLLVPLVGYLLLKIYLQLSMVELATRFMVTVAMVVFMLVWRRRTTLSDSALLGAAFLCYVFWMVGGGNWLVGPLVLFVSYTAVWPRGEQIRQRPHDIHTVITVAGPGLIWLFLSRVLNHPQFFYTFMLSFAAQMTFIGASWVQATRPAAAPFRLAGLVAVQSWLLLFIPYVIIGRFARAAWYEAAAALLITLVVAAVGLRMHARARPADGSGFFLFRQVCTVMAASALGLFSLAPYTG